VSDATEILRRAQQGDPQAAAELLPLVYEELRKLAAAKLAHEAPGNTLQATALVHEAWLRVGGATNPSFNGRAHFFGAAAEAMRRILIDRARRRLALRHGGAQERIYPENLEDLDLAAPGADDQLIELNEALDKLARQHPVQAELVKLRYFTGLTVPEAAKVLGLTAHAAKEYAAHARAWLYREMTNRSP